MWKLPKITIIGQTNVGKSTLFNALSFYKKSIVTSVPGTTRDSYTTLINFSQHLFFLTDTGGFVKEKKGFYEKIIDQKNEKILQKSDWLFWVVDFGKTLDQNDFYISQKIKRYKQKTILIINKSEKFHHLDQIQHFYQLGIKKQIILAAKNKLYFSNLFSWIEKNIPQNNDFLDHLSSKKILILGQTNVGKSSLFNVICEKDKAIVSNKPHTTTNIVEELVFYKEHFLHFFDSAGLRRKKNRTTILEKKAFQQISKKIQDIDLVLFVLDISQELTTQDKKIINFILTFKKKFIIVANKYDLISENDIQLQKKIYSFFTFLKPLKTKIFFISTLDFLKARRSVKRLLNAIYLLLFFNSSS